jgi:hypothetical protein
MPEEYNLRVMRGSQTVPAPPTHIQPPPHLTWTATRSRLHDARGTSTEASRRARCTTRTAQAISVFGLDIFWAPAKFHVISQCSIASIYGRIFYLIYLQRKPSSNYKIGTLLEVEVTPRCGILYTFYYNYLLESPPFSCFSCFQLPAILSLLVTSPLCIKSGR